MKTLFMNPAGRVSSFSGAKSNMMNPRRSYRRKRRNSAVRIPKFSNPRRRSRRAKRRNAGIAPFVSRNPLILQNPRRRRRSRNPSLNFKNLFSKTLTYTGGAAIGAGANILALRRIENDWLRNGARLGTAIAAGYFLKGEMGAAAAGATLYPMFAELALMFNLTGDGAEATGVDLNELAADLEDALNEVDDEDSDIMYVP